VSIPESTLEALAAFPGTLKRCFFSFPEHRRNWKPTSWDGIPSERLSAIEQLCHVLDVETEGYQLRFRRTCIEHNPVLADLPGEAMAAQRRYSEADPDRVLQAFAAARSVTVAAIGNFTDAQLRRPAMFEGRPMTLRGLVHLLGSHDFQHLAGLQWLLARLPSE
jgi:hypothetical protein